MKKIKKTKNKNKNVILKEIYDVHNFQTIKTSSSEDKTFKLKIL